MKISVRNLGVLKQAEFELGDLTLICGDNNTGKTYATYALFGFLSKWRRLLSVDIPKSTIDELVKDGVAGNLGQPAPWLSGQPRNGAV